jgi:hypothetical protein
VRRFEANPAKVRLERRYLRVVRAHAITQDFECALIEAPRVGVVTSAAADHAEGAERGDKFGMVRAEVALLDGERASEVRFGSVKVSEPSVNGTEISQCDADLVVVGREGSLKGVERSLQHLRGFVMPAGGVEDRREGRAVGGGRRMIRAKGGLADACGLAGRRLSVGRPTCSVCQPTDVVQDGRHFGVLRTERSEQRSVRALVECRGLREPTHVLQQHAEVVTDASGRGIRGGAVTLSKAQRATVGAFSTRVVAGSASLAAEPV